VPAGGEPIPVKNRRYALSSERPAQELAYGGAVLGPGVAQQDARNGCDRGPIEQASHRTTP
jgi:hypothetical protein